MAPELDSAAQKQGVRRLLPMVVSAIGVICIAIALVHIAVGPRHVT